MGQLPASTRNHQTRRSVSEAPQSPPENQSGRLRKMPQSLVPVRATRATHPSVAARQKADQQHAERAARIASFEVIADLLWRSSEAPTAQDFLNARIEYAIDQGLDSRVQRRYDAHVTRPEEGVNCRGADHGELYPDYCVGPGQIMPLLTAAFASGSLGESPLKNAAEVEAGLLWFLYISTYKEAYT